MSELGEYIAELKFNTLNDYLRRGRPYRGVSTVELQSLVVDAAQRWAKHPLCSRFGSWTSDLAAELALRGLEPDIGDDALDTLGAVAVSWLDNPATRDTRH